MARDMTVPLFVGGDFNVIWDEEEKYGGFPVSLNETDDFRHCINTCNLVDLGFKGSIFTWWNGRAEEDCIFKMLDRCLSNVEFQHTFPGIEVTHLSKIGSDHSPMQLKCDIEVPLVKKPFRFLNLWVEHESFKETVRENWKADFSASLFVMFNYKLKKLKKALLVWSRATYGDIFQKIASLEEVVLVHEAQFETNPIKLNREILHKVQADLIKFLALEEKYWKQKSASKKEAASQKDSKQSRYWIEEDEEIAMEAVNFYKEQFKETTMPTSFHILDRVPTLVDMEQNSELMKQPTKDEKKEVTTFFDLRPISLSNYSNKLILRVIHERLVGLLPNIISEEHVGFVKGRSIVENVLLTQEIITDIRRRTKAGPNVVMKLDMTKAYDKLSWLFLTKVLRKMGFAERFIGMVFGIVSNNWYSILINSQAHAFVKSSRGVK
ncbi:uncharacterized protein LOC142177156 [Nicotiana tabacum]|uniref:Uncharacterized protein LOC142177156 n=1 Tax=Nicotiana tabacum TaxID=4097 RepID=A0AC58TWZ0_TOBAC